MCRFKVGRPRKFNDAKAFVKLINDYIDSCYQQFTDENGNVIEKNIHPITFRGFAVFIGVNADTIYEWVNTREDLSDSIKELRQICKNFAEEKLFDRNAPTAGIIFNLKNNWGYVDKQEVETKNTNINSTLNIEFVGDED